MLTAITREWSSFLKLRRCSSSHNREGSGAPAHMKPISKTVILGIVAASLVALISLLTILIFLVKGCRCRRRYGGGQPPDAGSPVLPIQDPDLEAGPDIFEGKQVDDDMKFNQNNSGYTIESFASRPSRGSSTGTLDARGETPSLPGLPAVPRSASLTISESQRHQRSVSTYSTRSGSASLHSLDNDSVSDNYYYRHSSSSQNSVSGNSDSSCERGSLIADSAVTL